VGCVAGALIKDDYLAAITSAGFENVNVIDERPFSIMAVATDPFVKSLMDDFNLTAEQVKEISESIVSIEGEGKK
jgi:arsenite methyltransferase